MMLKHHLRALGALPPKVLSSVHIGRQLIASKCVAASLIRESGVRGLLHLAVLVISIER